MRLAELLMGSRITMGLRVVVERRIPDLLGDDPKSAAELASQAGIPAPSLRRLMRALSYFGVFREESDGRFGNTEVSAYLRSDADPSLRRGEIDGLGRQPSPARTTLPTVSSILKSPWRACSC
jgi:hypothetical protein